MSLLALSLRHKSKFLIAKLSSLQVIINFLTSILILKELGLGGHLDVFYIAMSVFAFLYTAINWPISSVLVPYLVDNRGKNKEGALFISLAILTLPIALIMFASMPFWAEYLFVNYVGSIPMDTIIKVQALLIGAFVIDSLTMTYFAMLQEKNKYVTFNLANVLASLAGLTFVYLTINTFGVFAAAANQLLIKLSIFSVLSFVFLPQILKTLSFDFEQLKLIFNRAKYLLLGALYFRTEEMTERYIASYLSEGFVSLLSFVQRIYGAMVTVLNSAIGVPSITTFSNLVKAEAYDQIKTSLNRYIVTLIVISGVIFVTMFFIGEWLLLQLVQESVSVKLTPMIKPTILCVFVFVLFKPISLVLQSLLMSLRKGSISTAYDAATYTINLIIKIGLTIQYGMYGLLVAIIITSIITDGAKYYLVNKELQKFKQ